MRNYWVQKDDDSFYSWNFTIDPSNVSIQAISDLAIFVNDVLEQEKLLVIDAFDDPRGQYQYRRAEHGSMASFCKHLFDKNGLIQFPNGDLDLRTNINAMTTTLAYYNANDKLVEKPVQDLGILLRDLEPVPGAILKHLRRRGYPPLRASGSTTMLSDIHSRQVVGFSLDTFSNIWAPYIWRSSHPWRNREMYFDNRPLAYRHTTRLNRVLSKFADMATELGGTWALIEAGPFAHDRGINLEPVLDAAVAEGAENVEWVDIFDEYGVDEDQRDYDFGC
jgi:hypothetical protein